MGISVVEKGALIQDNYLQELLQQSEASKAVVDTKFLQTLRHNGAVSARELSLPTKQDEDWRFTDLSELYQIQFQPTQTATITSATLANFVLPETEKSCLVFVNGQYAPTLSDVSVLPEGVYVGNLGGLSDTQNQKIVKYLGKQPGNLDGFTALNTAGITDAAVIWVNPNVIVSTPIQVLFLAVASDIPKLIQPRILVVAEKGSSLQWVEYYATVAEDCASVPQSQPYFTNSVTEIWVEDNAQVNHSRIQRELGDSFHIGRSAIAQSQDSRYTCNEINLGGKLSRHTLEVWQNGHQTETHLNGLTAIGNQQVADTHSAVFLNHPQSTTHQLHKCIMDDQAHGIFSGKISVPKAAQLTNATQLNRNLLLSSKARINTKPELQITADNVKCSHGATVSQLEPDELFYLQSRGLNETDARHLLIDAFAAEILEQLPLESLQQRLTQCVACRTVDI